MDANCVLSVKDNFFYANTNKHTARLTNFCDPQEEKYI